MWETWESCPVQFPDVMGDWDGFYDSEKDIIYINLAKLNVNYVVVYLWCLIYRHHHKTKNKDWVTEQAVLMWNTMSKAEKLKLAKMLFG